MRLLFQSIGVLVHYNWALPYYLTKLREESRIDNLTNFFSYFMGGYYYHLKSFGRVSPVFEEIGIGNVRTLDKMLKIMHIKKLMKKNYDIIHLNRVVKDFCETKVPKILTLHGICSDFEQCFDSFDACNVLREIQKCVEVIVAPSNHCAKAVKEACKIDVEVIHHGIDTEIFNPYIISKCKARKILGLPLHNAIILWNARISPEKNLEMALKVLKRILKERKDVILLIKGRAADRNYMVKIRSLKKKLGLEHNVMFDHRWVPSMNKIAMYYRASDIYIHTSITEAFGLAVAEAMACGIPVVAYRRSAVPEVVGDAGYLVNDVEEFAEKVLEVLNNEKVRDYLSLKAVKRIHERFSLKSTASKYLQIYNKL